MSDAFTSFVKFLGVKEPMIKLIIDDNTEEQEEIELDTFKHKQRVIVERLQAICMQESKKLSPDPTIIHTCQMAICNAIEAGVKADYLFLSD